MSRSNQDIDEPTLPLMDKLQAVILHQQAQFFEQTVL